MTQWFVRSMRGQIVANSSAHERVALIRDNKLCTEAFHTAGREGG